MPKFMDLTGPEFDKILSIAIASLKLKQSVAKAKSSVKAPQNDDELWDYVRDTWDYEIPRYVHPECEDRGHVAPFEAFAESYFARVKNSMWLGSRGFSGKSLTSSILCITEETTLGAEVALLGGSKEQAARCHEYTQGFWELPTAPTHLLMESPTLSKTKLTNGGIETVQAASSKSVRGAHPQRLRGDEVDEMDIAILDAALGQPLEKNGITDQVTLTSTHHYPNGPVTEMKRRVADGEGNWVIREWCYKEGLRRKLPAGLPKYHGKDKPGTFIGWISEEMIRSAKDRVSEEMFRVEYDLQEPAFEGRAINGDAVRIVYNKKWNPKIEGVPMFFKGVNNEIVKIACCANMDYRVGPCSHHSYATGIDWGRTRDYTVITTYRTDMHPWWMVEFQKFHGVPGPQMFERAANRVKKYPGPALHDATGMGGIIADDILDIDPEIDITGVTMNAKLRAEIVNDYIVGVERHALAHPRIETAYNDLYYLTANDLTGSGHLPDSFVASALAWHTRVSNLNTGTGISSLEKENILVGIGMID